MNMEVTLVSKREQVVSRTPAAVYVITQEEIRRSGMSSIPELLRLVPGFQVGRIDSSKWAISARGFSGRFADKLLVMVDGRTVYSPLFSGVYWELLDTLLADIERVEVIRGPGATMWGANAVNGVVNIVTKKARDTQGAYAAVQSGNIDLGIGEFRYGGKLGMGKRVEGHWRGYTKYLKRNHTSLLGLDPVRTPAGDEWSSMRTGFRTDFAVSKRDTLSFTGDLTEVQPRTRYQLPGEPPHYTRQVDERASAGAGFVQGLWEREDKVTGTATKLQAFFDHTHRKTALIEDSRDTVNLDLQQRRRVWTGSRFGHELMWGAGFGLSTSGTTATPYARMTPASRTDPLFTVFLQDEISLSPEVWSVAVGAKVEHNNYTGLEVQPSARLLWTPGKRHTLWAALSRAVSTPARADHDIFATVASYPDPRGIPIAVTLAGNPNLPAEKIISAEAGFRWQTRRVITLDLALFRSSYDDVFSTEMTAPIFREGLIEAPLRIDKGVYGTTWGGELSMLWKVRPWWKLSGSYTRLALDLHQRSWSNGADYLRFRRESPDHQAQVRSYLDLPGGFEIDMALYAVGDLGPAPPPGIIPVLRPSLRRYQRYDARLGWRSRSGIEVSTGTQDSLDPRHPEFFSELPGAVPTEVGRSFYVRLGRRF
jgi:iron complex outermembrane receptor protein